MTHWYYYEKISVTGEELKELAKKGTITPETFIEDPTGRTGLAKDVKGLAFSETLELQPSSEAMPSEPKPLSSFPVSIVDNTSVATGQAEMSGNHEFFDGGNETFEQPQPVYVPPRLGDRHHRELVDQIMETPNQVRKLKLIEEYVRDYNDGKPLNNLSMRQFGVRGY